ncbi:uncharacterized protein LOC115369236 isoform X4 [Myripristis murdjan]|uniref:uncharacterized protein LOC115369236 isoform X4 n=1 Tax=Myripristis murdjan TaxID=586833 RepID=UPI0011763F19|nr:uncharacterized protein LOC115369236 isoform X4 [Myripristis murdjan]
MSVAMFQLLFCALTFVAYLKDVNCSPIQGGDTDWLTRTLHYMEKNPETGQELTNSSDVLEGDILIPSYRNVVGATWPGVDIPYLISPEIGKKRNFQVQNGNTFNLSYDLTSILHYGRHFFSVNNLPTIMSKKNEKAMGQRTYMSKLDIQRVRILYNCDAKENQTAGDWSQQNGPRHANAGRQNDNTTHHLPETRQDSRQNSTESASRHVSGSSATNTTSGFNQDDISTSPLLNSNTTSESHPSRM